MADRDSTERAEEKHGPLPTISLPTGGGAIRGIGEKFGVNPVTGTASLSIPLPASPSRGDFAPQLTLSYDSGAGNGPFGLGWQLPVPVITRKTDRGLPRYLDGEESDVFVLSVAEDLVPVLVEVAGELVRKSMTTTDGGRAYRVDTYRPRVEGLYARIERWTESTGEVHWRTVSTDNVTTLYGLTAESRVADPTDSHRVATWSICESFDDRGNAVLYRYAADDSTGVDEGQVHERNRTAADRPAQRYLKRVQYGNRTPHRAGDDMAARTDWMFELVFDYGEHYDEDAAGQPTLVAAQPQRPWTVRADPFSTYRAGFEVRTYRLCRRVLVFHHFAELGTADTLVKAIHFAFRETPVASFISSITSSGYVRRDDGTYLKRSMPPLDLTYTEATLHAEVREVDPASLAHLPAGLAGSDWVDVDGDGVAGLLAEDAGGGWSYVPNLSPLAPAGRGDGDAVRFGAVRQVASRPTTAAGSVRWLDVAGDGQADLVQLGGPLSGYHERAADGDWERFVPFPSAPQVAWDSKAVTLLDLTGDGNADVLVTDDDAVTWYQSQGQGGFAAAERVVNHLDEERGPRVLLQDAEQTIHVADLSGDGLSDLVRIRNGEVCYWPNLGYGRFGAKVTMDDAPWFDHDFDPGRLRFADVDGSGPTDLLYLSDDGVHIYANHSGNRWGGRQAITAFPLVDRDVSVQVADVFGNGTACLLWSSPQLADAGRQLRYIDLMGGQKPHLLIGTVNNLGGVSRIGYSSSARFRLEDELAGRPWATRLPFPVHVVERVETEDLVNRTRFTTRYAYHHGYFDGTEREFRGFGLVEQYDTEELAVLTSDGTLPADNFDPASHVPPVLTRSWFHTGAWLDGDGLSAHYETEYYREPGLDPAQQRSMLLPDTVLAGDLTPDEAREAVRALKGVLLRKEVYALDGTPAELHPYTVSEHSYTVERKQLRGGHRNSVFCTHAAETVDLQYERATFVAAGATVADPRTHHTLVLDVDDFGHALRTVDIVYGRRHADPQLEPADQAEQRRAHVTLRSARYTNAVDRPDAYRAPQLCETSTYELLNIVPQPAPAAPALVPLATVRARAATASDGNHDLPFEDVTATGATPGQPFRRLTGRTRTLYRRDDLTGPLAFGSVESLVVPFEVYTLAFTPALLAHGFDGRVTDEMLVEGGYVNLDGSSEWWSPSGRLSYSPDPASTPAQELAYARQHFFLPHRVRDPYGNTSSVRYDAHDLLLLDNRDAVDNRTTAGARASDGTITSALDYRVLQPALVMDPNRNRTTIAYDVLGHVAGVAVMGKPGENVGDTLAGFVADLTQEDVDAFFADPLAEAPAVLGGATRRMVYDIDRFRTKGRPTFAATMARETRGSAGGRINVMFGHSNGLGATAQEKTLTSPGPVGAGGPAPRWVGSGWTILDNKGQPVKQYEPFFSSTHDFEFARTVGVSGTSLYDPIGRVVARLHPDHSYDKTVFGPWRQAAWDANDTVLVADPASDLDVGDHFARLPATDYLPTWHTSRVAGGLGPVDQEAATKASAHAATPTVSHYDALGRPFLTVQDNGDAGSIATRLVHDIAGNVRAIMDSLGRTVVRGDYDLQGRRLHHETVDGGARFNLQDVLGQTIRAWDSRGQMVRHAYDANRRPTDVFVTDGAGAERLIERIVYGESVGDTTNHRGRLYQRMDSAGLVTEETYDFDGNLLDEIRQLAADDRVDPDWSRPVALDPEQHRGTTEYDAVKRPTRVVSPDGTVTHLTYDEQGALTRLEANVRGESTRTVFLTGIEHNARGQVLRAELGNGVVNENDYDPVTFRLRRGRTLRGTTALVDLRYVYDAVGNITARRDGVQQTQFFANTVVEPDGDYTYDAIYRLVAATGREHRGQGPQTPEFEPRDAPRTGFAHPQDGQAMRRYSEQYAYDVVGNLLSVVHQASAGSWARRYDYETGTNRLRSTSLPGDPASGPLPIRYTYDAHGSMTALPHLASLEWDVRDRLRTVDLGGGGTATYVYDAAGRRVRKVIRRQNGTKQRERIYVGTVEIFREYAGDGTTVTLERQTLLPQPGRPAHVETRTIGTDPGPARLVRHQFADLLGSVALELDESAQIIGYEEYYPYGGTAYQAARSQTETPKRYRYNGKERDDETGLYYYGARYYAAWLGRWTAVDPAGLIDGVNVYVYARSNPVGISDPTGHEGLAAAFSHEGKYAHSVTYANLDAYGASGAGSDFVQNADGTVTATVWRDTPAPTVAPQKPAPKAAPPPPKKVATPAQEPPVDVRDLFRIAKRIGPGWHYGETAMQVFGGIQFVGGSLEAIGGAIGAVVLAPTLAGEVAGAAVMLHGIDQASSGWNQMWSGKPSKTATYMLGEGAAKQFTEDPEWHQFGGEFAEAAANAGSVAYGGYLATRPADIGKMMAKLPPLPTAISELEYTNIHNRPGSAVAMGQYGPYRYGMTIGEQAWRRMAITRGARTLGTMEAVPLAVREQGAAAVVQHELGYLKDAEHIWFFRTGFESPTATPITWLELEAIAADPALAAKTTHVPVMYNPLLRPVPRAKPPTP